VASSTSLSLSEIPAITSDGTGDNGSNKMAEVGRGTGIVDGRFEAMIEVYAAAEMLRYEQQIRPQH
jgi:hypothetical protein